MIKIKRFSDSIDFYEAYRVVIDDKTVMELGNNELRDYNLEEGEHTIRIVSDKYVSETLTFQNYDGEIIEFECKPDHKDSKMSYLSRKVFLGKLGIELKKKTDFYL